MSSANLRDMFSADSNLFTGKAADYAKYKGGYSPSLAAFFEESFLAAKNTRVADLGSGTGHLTQVLLDLDCDVIAIEPNEDMRSIANTRFKHHRNFSSFSGSAENTGLTERSVDLVTAGRAFQWFKPSVAFKEIRRILKPGGHLAIVWNIRKQPLTPFMAAYENLLFTYCDNFPHQYRRLLASILFLEKRGFQRTQLEHSYPIDLDIFRGLVRSLSGSPAPGHRMHRRMMESADNIFVQHQQNDRVRFDYSTVVYVNRDGLT